MMIISRYCEFVAYDAFIVDKAKGHDTTDDIPKYSKHEHCQLPLFSTVAQANTACPVSASAPWNPQPVAKFHRNLFSSPTS
jgi:hypothetical protein